MNCLNQSGCGSCQSVYGCVACPHGKIKLKFLGADRDAEGSFCWPGQFLSLKDKKIGNDLLSLTAECPSELPWFEGVHSNNCILSDIRVIYFGILFVALILGCCCCCCCCCCRRGRERSTSYVVYHGVPNPGNGQIITTGGNMMTNNGQMMNNGNVMTNNGQMVTNNGQMMTTNGNMMTNNGQMVNNGNVMMTNNGQSNFYPNNTNANKHTVDIELSNKV